MFDTYPNRFSQFLLWQLNKSGKLKPCGRLGKKTRIWQQSDIDRYLTRFENNNNAPQRPINNQKQGLDPKEAQELGDKLDLIIALLERIDSNLTKAITNLSQREYIVKIKQADS